MLTAIHCKSLSAFLLENPVKETIYYSKTF